MLILLLLIVYGIVFALFATQNTGSVPITLFNYNLASVPIYLVALGSLLLGTAISWLISLINGISSSLTIHGKNSTIKDAHKTIEQLKNENNRLALENAELKGAQQATQATHPEVHTEDVDFPQHA